MAFVAPNFINIKKIKIENINHCNIYTHMKMPLIQYLKTIKNIVKQKHQFKIYIYINKIKNKIKKSKILNIKKEKKKVVVIVKQKENHVKVELALKTKLIIKSIRKKKL